MTEEERLRAQAIHDAEVPGIASEVFAAAGSLVVGAMLGGFAGTVLIVIAWSILSLPTGLWVVQGQATFALLGAVYAGWTVFAPRRARREKTRPLQDDVADGVVEVLDVEAFIAWSEFDAVPAFSLDIADEKPLLVRGAALAEAVSAGAFPCRKFRLVRLPSSKHALSVEPRGEPLPVRG